MSNGKQALNSLFGIIVDAAETISATTNTLSTVVLMANDQAQYHRTRGQTAITIGLSVHQDQMIEDKAMEMAERADKIRTWANTEQRQADFGNAQSKLQGLFVKA